jgi:hypothetical protein
MQSNKDFFKSTCPDCFRNQGYSVVLKNERDDIYMCPTCGHKFRRSKEGGVEKLTPYKAPESSFVDVKFGMSEKEEPRPTSATEETEEELEPLEEIPSVEEPTEKEPSNEIEEEEELFTRPRIRQMGEEEEEEEEED